jgi:hypothetical protein
LPRRRSPSQADRPRRLVRQTGTADPTARIRVAGPQLAPQHLPDRSRDSASSVAFIRGIFIHGIFIRGIFIHGIFIHGIFIHGIFIHGIFIHGIFIHGFFIHGFFIHGFTRSG